MDNSRGRFGRRAFLAAIGAVALTSACGGGGGGALGSDDQDLDATGSTAAPATTPPTAAPSPTTPAPAGPSRWVSRGPTSANRVALTFHTDGDLSLADQVLQTLKAHAAPMTAFVVGSWLAAHPDWAKRLTDDGHELANHSYTHPTFATLTPAAMTDEITRTRDLLVQLTGKPGAYFRPSGTDNGIDTPSAAVLAAAGGAGYAVTLGYDVDPLDYQDPSAAVVTQRTLDGVTPGAIVSLHFGHPNTIAALPGILDGLASRGLTPVTASKLLG